MLNCITFTNHYRIFILKAKETRSKLDTKRIVLSNIPNEINKEYLELYLEYLSDEIAVERFDFSTEIKNIILVTFIKSIGIYIDLFCKAKF